MLLRYLPLSYVHSNYAMIPLLFLLLLEKEI